MPPLSNKSIHRPQVEYTSHHTLGIIQSLSAAWRDPLKTQSMLNQLKWKDDRILVKRIFNNDPENDNVRVYDPNEIHNAKSDIIDLFIFIPGTTRTPAARQGKS